MIHIIFCHIMIRANFSEHFRSISYWTYDSRELWVSPMCLGFLHAINQTSYNISYQLLCHTRRHNLVRTSPFDSNVDPSQFPVIAWLSGFVIGYIHVHVYASHMADPVNSVCDIFFISYTPARGYGRELNRYLTSWIPLFTCSKDEMSWAHC